MCVGYVCVMCVWYVCVMCVRWESNTVLWTLVPVILLIGVCACSCQFNSRCCRSIGFTKLLRVSPIHDCSLGLIQAHQKWNVSYDFSYFSSSFWNAYNNIHDIEFVWQPVNNQHFTFVWISLIPYSVFSTHTTCHYWIAQSCYRPNFCLNTDCCIRDYRLVCISWKT